MDAFPVADEPAMARSSIVHASILDTSNGNGDRPPIGQVDHQTIFGNLNVLDSGLNFNR